MPTLNFVVCFFFFLSSRCLSDETSNRKNGDQLAPESLRSDHQQPGLLRLARAKRYHSRTAR